VINPGDMVILPADGNGIRHIMYAPNSDLAVQELRKSGAESYYGEMPACGYILEADRAKWKESQRSYNTVGSPFHSSSDVGII